jgi:hypothetical protein
MTGELPTGWSDQSRTTMNRTSGTRHRVRLVQNLRRAHYEIAAHEPAGRRLAAAFAEPAKVI